MEAGECNLDILLIVLKPCDQCHVTYECILLLRFETLKNKKSFICHPSIKCRDRNNGFLSNVCYKCHCFIFDMTDENNGKVGPIFVRYASTGDTFTAFSSLKF